MSLTTVEQIQPYANKFGFSFEEGMVVVVFTSNTATYEQMEADFLLGADAEPGQMYATARNDYREVCFIGEVTLTPEAVEMWTEVTGV